MSEKLDRYERNFVYVGFNGSMPEDAQPPELELNGGWHPMVWWDAAPNDDDWDSFLRILEKLEISEIQYEAGNARVSRMLVAGPLASASGAVQLPEVTRYPTRVRFSGSPEIVSERGEFIDVI